MEKKILYVDDEPTNLNVFKLAFKKEFEIFIAENAEDALQILDQNHIQVLVIDQRMPDITGTQLIKIIQNKHPYILVMVLTGFADIQMVLDAINECNIFRYFIKPWKESEMRLALQKALESYHLQSQNRVLVQQLTDFNQVLEKIVEEKNKQIEDLLQEIKALKKQS